MEEATAKLTDPVDRARLEGLRSSTLHRLLGWRPDSSVRFRHNRANRLPHDVIVVDETSMVSLTMMARLLEAVRPDARLVLVGDPDQLASVEAGAVLADLVAGFAGSADSPVAPLADHAPVRSPHRCARPGPAGRRRGCRDGLAHGRVRRGGARRPDRRVRDVELPRPGHRRGRRLAPGRGARRRAGCPRGPLTTPVAVRAPRGSLRRERLEPAGRATRLRAHRRHPLRRVVRRAADPGHCQRLRPAAQQR